MVENSSGANKRGRIATPEGQYLSYENVMISPGVLGPFPTDEVAEGSTQYRAPLYPVAANFQSGTPPSGKVVPKLGLIGLQ